MRHVLTPHPDTPCEAVESLEADVIRTADGLGLRYVLAGKIEALVLPPPAAPARAGELWRRTCFEAFVRGGGTGYCEVNLAPSGEWAAYRFDDYRAGMAPLDIPAPPIEVVTTDRRLELTATLAIVEGRRLGLSAVIEEQGGRISYWALAHPAGRPDFHHADCFAAELPAPLRP